MAAAAQDKKPKAETDLVEGAGDAPAEARRVVPLPISRSQLGEFLNARHSVSPASGTEFEDLLRPEYWANLVRLRAGDIIEVRPEDQSYYAELYVLRRDRNSASVAVIREPVKLVAVAAAPGATSFSVEFAGSHGKWRVIRSSDRAVMRDKFENEADARKWVAEYEQLLAVR